MRSIACLMCLMLVSLLPATGWAQAETDTESQPAAYQTQMIWFARSGKTVTVELAPTRAPKDRATLLAFGRTWTEPVNTRKQGIKFVADFKAPSVRVPTVFTIAHPDWPNQFTGYLVAYPDRDVEWDKKITLYSCGAPGWFDQWASAVGLPVKAIAIADLPVAKLVPADEKGSSLLILGRDSAGKDMPDAAKLAAGKKINALVIDAPWFGDAAGAVSVATGQMAAGLTGIAKQRWPKPLEFSGRRRPYAGIANRWAWIADDRGLPLVEQFLSGFERPYSAMRPVIASYLPWQGQLGRCESADSTLLALLAATAKESSDRVGWRHAEFVYPKHHTLTADRPVLASAIDLVWKDAPQTSYIIDLRGKEHPPEEALGEFKLLERKINSDSSWLLILGDDKVLDEWDWLKLDRVKKTVGRAGAIWLSDDELPASKDQQIKLMMKLTELGVPLAPVLNEAKP